ncbi:MAG: carboxypeptidase regulatory-like domain-containing protein [Acidobacteria bacterium]|nr:carboxypeptidase regulatory-like domain-containing protein [Acidobacteriota bacterium]
MTAGRFRIVTTCVVVLLAVFAAGAHAQTGAASITGLIVDQTGASLPGVTVTATNQATNVAYVTTTNQSGNYTITPVVLGSYIVKAELTGFRTAATEPLTVEAMQVARLDFKMGVGGVAETLTVVSVAPILQTETSTVGEVLRATPYSRFR